METSLGPLSGDSLHCPGCPVLCVGARAVACRFTDARKMFRTECISGEFAGQMQGILQSFDAENTEKFLDRHTDCSVYESPTNET